MIVLADMNVSELAAWGGLALAFSIALAIVWTACRAVKFLKENDLMTVNTGRLLQRWLEWGFCFLLGIVISMVGFWLQYGKDMVTRAEVNEMIPQHPVVVKLAASQDTQDALLIEVKTQHAILLDKTNIILIQQARIMDKMGLTKGGK